MITKLIQKATGKQLTRGDLVIVPYYGVVRLVDFDFYGPGEWSNFIDKESSCVVVSWANYQTGELLVEDVALGHARLNGTASLFSFMVE